MTQPPSASRASGAAPRSTSPPPDRAGESQLFSAVRAALHVLNGRAEERNDATGDVAAPARIAQYLRAVLVMVSATPAGSGSHRSGPTGSGTNGCGSTGSGPYDEAVAALTAACADLDDGDLPGAYLALRVADTALHEAARS